MEKYKFKEKQAYNDKKIMLFLIATITFLLVSLAQSVIQNNWTIMSVLIYLVVVTLIGFQFWRLKKMELTISVNKKRIKFKMFPFHTEAQKIKWEEVQSCEIVKTPFGIQWHGEYSHEAYFSLTGRNGLALTTKDGERYFIGCQNVDELANFLEKSSLNVSL